MFRRTKLDSGRDDSAASRRERWSPQAAQMILAARTMLAAAVFLGLAGCEKPPTFQELMGNKKPDPAAPSKAVGQPPVQAPQLTPPPPKQPQAPKKTPQEVIAEFKATPPERRTDRQILELTSLGDGLDQFTEMDLTMSAVSHPGMAALPKLPNLEKLTLDGCNYGSQAVGDLAHIKNLTSLSMKGGPRQDKFHDAALEQLKGMKQLRSLRIDQWQVSSQALDATVAKMDWLEVLSVSNTQFTDLDLKALAGLRELKELDISGTQVTDAGCEFLQPFTNLESLGMANLRSFRGQGLFELARRGKLKKLRMLNLYDNHEFLQPGYEAIARLRNLESLDVTHSGCSDNYFTNAIALHSKLTYLGVGDLILTDQGMRSLPRLKNLERLFIDSAGISDVSLQQVAKLKSLQRLSIRATSCTATGMQTLLRKLPPECVVFFNQKKLQ